MLLKIKPRQILAVYCISLILLLNGCSFQNQNLSSVQQLSFPNSQPMQISSSAFGNNQKIPANYTCDGKNVNPPLEISGAPAEAKSLVLIVDDPDAPRGIWNHWTLWNLNPQTTTIAGNSVPQGAVQGITSFGTTGYGGPCPPSGTHRYIFKLYALNTVLDLSSSTTSSELKTALEGHILTTAEYTGIYARN